MKERPILFSGPMVRAILSGAKTQFRRILKPQPAPYVEFVREHAPEVYGPGALCAFREDGKTHHRMAPCPYGQPGDRLYVKETWAPRDQQAMTERDRSSVFYRADDERRHETDGRWKSPIHMPRWASRLTLEITGVRVERLQAISEADAIAEGVTAVSSGGVTLFTTTGVNCFQTAKDAYAALWESINGPGSWDANPLVWVVEFRRIDK